MRIRKVRVLIVKEFKENVRQSGSKIMIIALPILVIPYMCILYFLAPGQMDSFMNNDWGYYYFTILISSIFVIKVSGDSMTDSFLGESDRKTLELLFATPLTDLEILVGKTVSSVLPSVIGSHLFIILQALATSIFLKAKGATASVSFVKIIYIIIILPLVSLLFCGLLSSLSTRFSSRNFVQGASFIGMIPLLGILIGFHVRILNSYVLMLIVTLALLILEVITFYVSARAFKREEILIRLC